MVLSEAFKTKLDAIFLAEEQRGEDSTAFEALRRFLNGMTLWKEKSRLVLPLQLVAGFGVLMLFLVLLDHVLSFGEVSFTEKFLAYNLNYPIILESIVVMRNRRELREITLIMDQWWDHSYLEKEAVLLKKKVSTWVEWFSSSYYFIMIGGFLSYLLLPIFKYFYNGREDIKDLFLYRCWSPFSAQTPWGFAFTYILETVGLYLPFFMYAGIGTYLITMTQLFCYQVDLIVVAYSTIEERVVLRATQFNRPSDKFKPGESLMKYEIRNCAMHYQKLYWCLARTCNIFMPTTNIMYYSGLCVVVYVGTQLLNNSYDPLFVIQSIVLIFAVLVNQYINSYVTETLADKANELRNAVYDCPWYRMPVSCRKDLYLTIVMSSHSPRLATILGSVCNKESFMKIINASYCYINTLLTMKIRL